MHPNKSTTADRAAHKTSSRPKKPLVNRQKFKSWSLDAPERYSLSNRLPGDRHNKDDILKKASCPSSTLIVLRMDTSK
jgi:hypothetical protein